MAYASLPGFVMFHCFLAFRLALHGELTKKIILMFFGNSVA